MSLDGRDNSPSVQSPSSQSLYQEGMYMYCKKAEKKVHTIVRQCLRFSVLTYSHGAVVTRSDQQGGHHKCSRARGTVVIDIEYRGGSRN